MKVKMLAILATCCLLAAPAYADDNAAAMSGTSSAVSGTNTDNPGAPSSMSGTANSMSGMSSGMSGASSMSGANDGTSADTATGDDDY